MTAVDLAVRRALPIDWRGFEWEHFNAFGRRRWVPLDRRHHANVGADLYATFAARAEPAPFEERVTAAVTARRRLARMHAAYRRRTR